MRIAERIVTITEKLQIPYVFKGSYRKANRSRLDSFMGIGDEKALKILQKVHTTFGVPTVTDIHAAEEATMAAEYVDILQIPAFLCRQTDLLVAAAKTGKTINIKKGQFLSPLAMRFAADKVVEAGNRNVMLTERGTTFGYQDLVIDYRGIPEMQTFGFPVILDVTHSLQQPNQTSGVTGGMPQLIETVAKAGVAVGVDGLFIETHENPAVAKSDGAQHAETRPAGRPADQIGPHPGSSQINSIYPEWNPKKTTEVVIYPRAVRQIVQEQFKFIII